MSQKQTQAAIPVKDLGADCQTVAQPSDPSALIEQAEAALLQDVTIICGANDGVKKISGQTVAQIRRAYEGEFNIAADARVFINGKETKNEEDVLQANDRLEFLKEAGQKG